MFLGNLNLGMDWSILRFGGLSEIFLFRIEAFGFK